MVLRRVKRKVKYMKVDALRHFRKTTAIYKIDRKVESGHLNVEYTFCYLDKWLMKLVSFRKLCVAQYSM